MTKFVFIGDPNDPDDHAPEMQAFGKVFPRGVPVEVAEELFILKLRGHSYFVEGDQGGRRAPSAPVPQAAGPDPRDDEIAFLKGRIEELEAELAAANELLGEAGDSSSAPEADYRTMSKTGLVAWAKAHLDLTLDARLKLETLQQQVADHIDAQDAE
jgi:hypothetical protein